MAAATTAKTATKTTAAAMERGLAVVVGVGPGLGSALARKFASEGYKVGMISRTMDNLTPVKKAIEDQTQGSKTSVCVAVDTSNFDDLKKGFATIRQELKNDYIEVLCWNASKLTRGSIMDLNVKDIESGFRCESLAALVAVQQVLPNQVQHKKGTILLSGATASLRGSALFAPLAMSKFALRALGQSIAREFGPQGIHCCHVVIDGQIATPRQVKMQPDRPLSAFLDPDEMAEAYWQLHSQSPTVWSQEIDIRPSVEKF